MPQPASIQPRHFLLLWAGSFLLWVVLAGPAWPDLVAGVFVAASAAWISLLLGFDTPAHPPRLGAWGGFLLRFLGETVHAGADVAWRVAQPSVPLDPGWIRHPYRLPAGADRELFLSISSLVPGSLPCGEESGKEVVHCLDLRQPVGAALAASERRLALAQGRRIDG